MKKVFSTVCMVLIMTSAMAQTSYIVKTKGAKKAETAQKAGEEAPKEEEADEPADFVGKNFKFLSLCDWKEGMKFMVLPEKYDLVVGTFCDEKGKDVSSGSLKYKIMVYKGHSVAKDGTALVNFVCQDNNKKYYYPIPNGSFEDYCYNKMGVPTLAYLGDVDKAREVLMGSTLYTKTTLYRVDTESDGDGFQEVTVPQGKEVKVVAIGVGTRNYPVKIIVEDEKGMQFYQNVAMSKTNSGMRDDEFIMDKAKYTFYGSFEIVDPKVAVAEDYAQYIGRQIYTKYMTYMVNPMGLNVSIPRLSQFTIKKIEAQDGPKMKVTLQSAKDGYQYVKEVAFKNTNVAGDIDGKKEDYYGFLFGEGSPTKGISAKHMEMIHRGRIAKGFTKNEVRMAMGEPNSKVKNSNGITVWKYNNGSVVKFNKSGRVI